MKKVLIAVDSVRYAESVLSSFYRLLSKPEEAVILHVENPGGKSLMYNMLGDAEMSTLKEMITDTKRKEEMDSKAERILSFYRNKIENGSLTKVRTATRVGRPAEEILRFAEEEGAEIIILGYNDKKGIERLIEGSVTKDIEKNAKVPVMVVKSGLMCEEPYSWSDAYAAMFVCSVLVIGLFILGIIFQNRAFMP